MRKRVVAAWGLLGVVILAAGGLGIWLSLLPAGTAASAPPVPASETAAMLEGLRPASGQRPVVAVIGLNDATETTDYLMPTGILRRAAIADVVMLATGPGPVQLYPALKVEPDATIAEFDASHPQGADYVIVPAMSRDDDPAVLAWLRQQADKGAIVIGVCAGAKVVGAAGLLDGKRATTHWYYLRDLLRRSPTIDYVADRRMVMDGNVVTTTGVTASMPMMLTLVEAIGGRARAEAVAQDLGVEYWGAQHASNAFTFTRPFATTVLANTMAFWNRDEFGVPLQPGVDEVALALVADAWSRTYRSGTVSFAASNSAIVTANGIRILPDRTMQDWPAAKSVPDFSGQPPAAALDQTLQAINARYGEGTTNVVAMQLEYPRSNAVQ
ncbi:DJ-1/PfpI family protein [Devosia ginsengisoli]|uniref:DJ-1/PfpI family protein n=1 Tax=Devosia ginsengisoli TaxID=400770 RepID=UPI0026EF2DCD|nr:DJ-1/PfpI family protein [Devosia ginsengisoli]MCR6670502.1 DJ-1/PfpI family protein [Devosia ginsengisoli]